MPRTSGQILGMAGSEREEPLMSVHNVFIAAASTWADWRQRRRAYGELIALDDRLLADIGLRRTDVPAIFHLKVFARPWMR